MDQALLLFGKVPRPGSVKTRLTPVLSPSEAARLYTAFLRDTLRQVDRLDVDVLLYAAPPVSEGDFDGLPVNLDVREQEGDGLGARMMNAFRRALGHGYERAVVMGTDHPTLPASFVRQAFQALEEPGSISIGPTDDGGFYLLGLNTVYPELFEDMSYSHARVFSDTLTRADRTDARLTVLPKWYDVDTPRDLDRLCRELTASGGDAPETRRLLSALGLKAQG